MDSPLVKAARLVIGRVPLDIPPAWAQRLCALSQHAQRFLPGASAKTSLSGAAPAHDDQQPASVPVDGLVQAGYDAVYGALPRSETFRRLWSEHACGLEYPHDFDHISFMTLAEISMVAELLALPPGGTLVDLACGAGGPGLWLARSSQTAVIGMDLSAVGLAQARQRAERLRMSSCSTFVQGSFASTGLDDSVADGVVSVDALQYAPDKRAVFAETARLLRPGARLVFTAFEVEPDRVRDIPILGDDPLADFGPLLEHVGLIVEHYEETPGWRDRLLATYQAILAAQDVLAEELGVPAYAALAAEMTVTLERDFYRRRVLVVARKP
jgi:SAM-dependent methyltransferase